MHTYLTSLLLVSGLAFGAATVSAERLWTIGQNDNQATGFALAPNQYKDFLAHDFGYEDRYFLVGFLKHRKIFRMLFPVLPTDGAVQAELPDGEHMKQLSYSV